MTNSVDYQISFGEHLHTAFRGRILSPRFLTLVVAVLAWPNSKDGVTAVIDYSAGKPVPLSFERLSLLFVR